MKSKVASKPPAHAKARKTAAPVKTVRSRKPAPSEAPPAKSAPVPAGEASTNLTDRAYAVVRRLILQRELIGGEVLVEGRLAERLQMSRTPLREALLRLEG